MSPEGTISAERVWKRFRPDVRRRLLRDTVERVGSRRRTGRPDWRWALRDVTVHANPGDAIGLVGRNGSGKSTLLKILARVMYPYAGRVEAVGRVGALIEVRAGIHPDLTGRENIYLYGTLLGLSRRGIAARFDDIVTFAELEDAVDRQVKFYSSGMQMRLGFSVAAHLDPDILLVDEVLAVGDASFQQRCLDRMRAVLNQGTTLVYVSHDLDTVEAVSTKGIWLHDGVVMTAGSARHTLTSYRRSFDQEPRFDIPADSVVRPVKVRISGPQGDSPRTEEQLEMTLVLESDIEEASRVHFGITEGGSSPILIFRKEILLQRGQMEIRCSIPSLPLPRGRFFVWFGASGKRKRMFVAWQPVARFDVIGPDLDPAPRGVVRMAPVHAPVEWESGPL